ncbi:MAG TPA: DNA-3-methyladenine glycosylase [Firmicutes bacterium]|nr:DNA-3-methyladenine glycosylase [Bacillota bacterium]
MPCPDQLQLAALPLRRLLAGDVVAAAAGLVGCVLARRTDAGIRRALIVETEAYHMRERGCHAYGGKTPRNSVMFGEPGRLYVYFTYGMWHCANVVCGEPGVAAAVLLRAASELPGPAANPDEPLRLSGPGLLCRGLELDREDNGANLLDRRGSVWLYRPAGYAPPPLGNTTRIGFSFEDTLPWRFFWAGHPDVSKARTGPLKRKRRE